ncbi:hypothetical protein PVAP13_8NG251601 [Panicum virgatum]|uniref:Uncharacterized protein n=1 Tax=Panicum virgatum TaxID=38727 RepID=A0A8T0P9X3_PANVG|nr:hypothetical protein PVAP13_8NG251601 [Panicum virgatum]
MACISCGTSVKVYCQPPLYNLQWIGRLLWYTVHRM